MILSEGGPGGLVFDANTTNSFQTDANGRILDPPIMSSMTLQLSSPTVDADFTIGIWVVPEAAAEDYSGSLVPLGRDEIFLEYVALTTSASPVVTEVNLATGSCDLIRAHVVARAGWEGRVALSFEMFSTSVPGATLTIEADGTSLEMEQSPFFSGLIGGPYGGKVRAVRDGRYAMGIFSPEVIRDGDQPSLWVRTFDWDPEDEDATYRPRPGEGSVDDDVSNI